MNMNTSRLDDKLNGLLIAAFAAILLCANYEAVQSESDVPLAATPATTQVVAEAATPVTAAAPIAR